MTIAYLNMKIRDSILSNQLSYHIVFQKKKKNHIIYFSHKKKFHIMYRFLKKKKKKSNHIYIYIYIFFLII